MNLGVSACQEDITRVHVVPEPKSFTIQVISPALVVEMDFADAERVREALAFFEAKKVLEVRSGCFGEMGLCCCRSSTVLEADEYSSSRICEPSMSLTAILSRALSRIPNGMIRL